MQENSIIKRSKRVYMSELSLIGDIELMKKLMECRLWACLSTSDSSGINLNIEVVIRNINEWLCENCEGRYMYEMPSEGLSYGINASSITFHISFELTTDATHFKLRWAD